MSGTTISERVTTPEHTGRAADQGGWLGHTTSLVAMHLAGALHECVVEPSGLTFVDDGAEQCLRPWGLQGCA